MGFGPLCPEPQAKQELRLGSVDATATTRHLFWGLMHEKLRARSWGLELMLRSVVTVVPPSLFHWTWLITPSTGSFPA